MRHLKSGRKFSIASSHRNAMFRNMVTSLMRHGRVRTTDKKAKELRGIAEHIITLSKRVPVASLEGLEGVALREAKARRVHAIRQARLWIADRDVLTKVFTEHSAHFANRPGGYTRILKLSRRPGDQTEMSLVELVTEPWPPTSEDSAGSQA
jgi:large subunit ribosomal protein L17